jgi:hypothetical protein
LLGVSSFARAAVAAGDARGWGLPAARSFGRVGAAGGGYPQNMMGAGRVVLVAGLREAMPRP